LSHHVVAVSALDIFFSHPGEAGDPMAEVTDLFNEKQGTVASASITRGRQENAKKPGGVN
jgi:hypothetical protein